MLIFVTSSFSERVYVIYPASVVSGLYSVAKLPSNIFCGAKPCFSITLALNVGSLVTGTYSPLLITISLNTTARLLFVAVIKILI
ncbi:hypothetical protein IMSAGC017_00569 [Thomasclavelia cocleata]|uniref:Uncharacterized protein n=1 Tax=Thomasclavelia cocleata TaxID=69824 RepID=A0A829Z8R3_9FIRM|nr:hypothetical protein IMSAGC017_00569 [Thomasclavelia cocleata]